MEESSYLETFNMLSRKYAMFLLNNHQKTSKIKVKDAYLQILSCHTMSEKVFNLWLENYADIKNSNKFDKFLDSQEASMGPQINEASQAWESGLKSLIRHSQLNSVVVWRLKKPSDSQIGYIVWDVASEPDFKLPNITINVEGGDKPDQNGNYFEWLLTVLPECFLDCVDYPLGGAGKSLPLSFTFNDLLNNSDRYDSFWMREKGTDIWAGLEFLFKLKTQIPDMTGSPVLNVKMESLVKKWLDILDIKAEK